MPWSNGSVRPGTQTLLAAIDVQIDTATACGNKTCEEVDFVSFMDDVKTHIGKLAQAWLKTSVGHLPLHANPYELGESRRMRFHSAYAVRV